MEHLTRQQIILLALFVSFFSSIATGIVVVSLMDQSTPTVTQTVNRVIERTIERVSSSTPAGKETVIVKDDQAIVDAIGIANKSVVRITDTPIGSTVEQYIGVGVIVSESGKIVAAADGSVINGTLSAHLDGGNVVPVKLVSIDSATGLSIFQADQSNDPRLARAYSAASLGESDALKLGQAVIMIGGYKVPIVATGIVTTLGDSGSSRIIANALALHSFDSRSILVNLLGEVIGLKDSSDISDAGASFIPSNTIKSYATPSTLHN